MTLKLCSAGECEIFNGLYVCLSQFQSHSMYSMWIWCIFWLKCICAFRFGADGRNTALHNFLWNVIKCTFWCESHMWRWPAWAERVWESEERVIYWREEQMKDGGRYCRRRENETCWQVVREEFRELTLSHYCLKNKTHCLQNRHV